MGENKRGKDTERERERKPEVREEGALLGFQMLFRAGRGVSLSGVRMVGVVC